MELSLTRYLLRDEEMEPLFQFLRKNGYRVNYSRNDERFFITKETREERQEYAYILPRKKRETYNRLEIIHGRDPVYHGDPLACIIYLHYKMKKTREHEERFRPATPPIDDSITIF